jgi:hypothetical protein
LKSLNVGTIASELDNSNTSKGSAFLYEKSPDGKKAIIITCAHNFIQPLNDRKTFSRAIKS